MKSVIALGGQRGKSLVPEATPYEQDFVLDEGFQVPQTSDAGRARVVFYLMVLGLVLFLVWASFFKIDQAVRAQGSVIASDRTQVVQVADGGILERLLVQEGDRVQQGQQLAVLEKGRASAAYEEIRSVIANLQVALIRAQAEGLYQTPVFNSISNEFAALAGVQQDLFMQNRIALDDQLNAVLDALRLAEEELRINNSLFSSGDISRLEVLRSQREVSGLEAQYQKIRNDYLLRARKEVTELEGQLARARHQLQERRNVLDHTILVSPVDGVVNDLKVTTLGGVLRAGDELMHISPTDGDVVIELQLQPADIGQLVLGLPVTVKLDAYDSSIFGGITGELVYLSSDTLVEQIGDQAVTYYRGLIRLHPQEQQLNGKIKLEQLKQGMTAVIDIRTGQRTVLEFIAKPIYRSFSGALLPQ